LSGALDDIYKKGSLGGTLPDSCFSTPEVGLLTDVLLAGGGTLVLLTAFPDDVDGGLF
jgi:hypothetical protein